MRFSLRSIFICTLISTLCLAIFNRPSPIEIMRSIDAVLAHGQPVDSLLIAIDVPRPMDEFLANMGIDEIDDVNTIWFDPNRPLAEWHIRLLSDFPNLHAVYLSGPFQSEWLYHLQDCEKLELVSLNGSNALDSSIQYLIDIPKICMIFTKNTSITQQGVRGFERSGPDRFANVYFTR